MKLIPFIAIWSVCGLAVLAIALYRKVLTFHGDDEFIHLADGEERLTPQQVARGHKLDLIDHWEKSLVLFTVTLGVVIAAVVLYQAWLASLQPK
jgi:hypothetical protein